MDFQIPCFPRAVATLDCYILFVKNYGVSCEKNST